MKSVITCDMEGVIETMNNDAEKIFGYKKEELIGKKRVSLFSPGMVVLGHVANWLDKAREKNVFEKLSEYFWGFSKPTKNQKLLREKYEC